MHVIVEFWSPGGGTLPQSLNNTCKGHPGGSAYDYSEQQWIRSSLMPFLWGIEHRARLQNIWERLVHRPLRKWDMASSRVNSTSLEPTPQITKNVDASKLGSLQHEFSLNNIMSTSIESSLSAGSSAKSIGYSAAQLIGNGHTIVGTPIVAGWKR